MTPTRYELVLEASADGAQWHARQPELRPCLGASSARPHAHLAPRRRHELPSLWKPVSLATPPKLVLGRRVNPGTAPSQRDPPQRLVSRRQVPPLHMPRLDWRLWFAALPSRPPAWVDPLLHKLLHGEPAVTGLLGSRPRAEPAQPCTPQHA